MLPYAVLTVENGLLSARFADNSGEIGKLSEIEFQLRQVSVLDRQDGLCIMTTMHPSLMWLLGIGLFYRLLFTINEPDKKPGYMVTKFRYQVHVYSNEIKVFDGWMGSQQFPLLATIPYGEQNVHNFDARPFFDF